MRRLTWRLALRGLALGVLAGGSSAAVCNPVSGFGCSTDEACIAEAGQGAVCESNAYCSVPDETCVDGRRWDDRAPSEIANHCLERVAGTGGTQGGSVSSGGSSSSSSGSSSSSDDGTTTGSADTTTSGAADTASPTTSSGDGTSTGAGSSSGGTSLMSCDNQYGDVSGYELCDEQPDSCSFRAVGMGVESCDEICETFGGTCISVASNGADLCVPTGDRTCDFNEFNDAICTCDRA